MPKKLKRTKSERKLKKKRLTDWPPRKQKTKKKRRLNRLNLLPRQPQRLLNWLKMLRKKRNKSKQKCLNHRLKQERGLHKK